MTLKEIRMPKGVKDIDDLIRSGVKVPEPIPTRGRVEEASQAVPAEPMLDFDDFLLKESSKDMEKKCLKMFSCWVEWRLRGSLPCSTVAQMQVRR